MSRIMAHTYKTDPCFPRVSGDEPRALTRLFVKDVFSPRERG